MLNEDKQSAIQLSATGMPQDEIAKTLGVSQPTISRLQKANQEAIQKETERLMSSIPDIIAQTARDIKTADKLSKALAGEGDIEELSDLLRSDKTILTKFMELAYKKQSDVLRTAGIFPSTTQSIYVQNLFQNGSQAIISPNILQVLGKHLKNVTEIEE